MPYVTEEIRKEIDMELRELITKIKYYNMTSREGVLNYVITTILDKGFEPNRQSYSLYNTKIGILECAKLELYRRKIAKYEDVKRRENGDVYR